LPYLSLGTITVEGDSDTYFTAHGEAGVSIALNDQLAVVPAYRYLWLNSGEAGFDDDTAHLFKVGVRFAF
jgi:opacity protein-like surface antigen